MAATALYYPAITVNFRAGYSGSNLNGKLSRLFCATKDNTTITSVLFQTGSVMEGKPVRVSIQGVAANGEPDGNNLGGSSPGVYSGSLSGSTIYTVPLGDPAVIAKGTYYFVVIEWDDEPGTMQIRTQTVSDAYRSPHSLANSSGTWTVASFHYYIYPLDGDGKLASGHSSPFRASAAAQGVPSTKEVGVLFQPELSGKISALLVHGTINSDDGQLTYRLYDDDDTLLGSGSITGNLLDLASHTTFGIPIPEGSELEVEAGKTYRLVFTSNKSSGINVYSDVYESAGQAGSNPFYPPVWVQTERSLPDGPWSETNTSKPTVALLFTDVSGGSLPSPGGDGEDRLFKHLPGSTGKTVYAVLRSLDGSYLVPAVGILAHGDPSDWDDYALEMTEGAITGDFSVAFPSAAPAGTYAITLYEQVGANPAPTDTIVGTGQYSWDGTEFLRTDPRAVETVVDKLDSTLEEVTPESGQYRLTATALSEAPSASVDLTPVKSVTDKIDTMLEPFDASYRLKSDALSQTPVPDVDLTPVTDVLGRVNNMLDPDEDRFIPEAVASVWNVVRDSPPTNSYGHLIDAQISSRSTYNGADTPGITTLLNRLDDTRAARLDNLDATISSRLASSTYTTPPTVESIVAGVWNEPRGTRPEGTFGALVDASISGVTTGSVSASDIAQAVLNQNIASANFEEGTIGDRISRIPNEPATAGEADAAINATGLSATVVERIDMAAITLTGRLTAERAAALDNLDAPVSSRSTYSGSDTPGVTTLMNRLNDSRALKLDYLDAPISSRSTYAGGDTPGVTILMSRLTAPRTAALDRLDVPVSSVTTGGVSAEAIAGAILTSSLTGEFATGTIGAKLQAMPDNR